MCRMGRYVQVYIGSISYRVYHCLHLLVFLCRLPLSPPAGFFSADCHCLHLLVFSLQITIISTCWFFLCRLPLSPSDGFFSADCHCLHLLVFSLQIAIVSTCWFFLCRLPLSPLIIFPLQVSLDFSPSPFCYSQCISSHSEDRASSLLTRMAKWRTPWMLSVRSVTARLSPSRRLVSAPSGNFPGPIM